MYWLRQYWNIIFSFCEQAQKWNILFQCSLRFFKITLAIFPLRIIDSLLLFLGAPYCYEAFCSLNILKEFSGLHYCLFVKVLVFHFVSKALYLLCFCCLCVSHATCLYYHVSRFVSTTFLNLFEWFYLVINYHLTAPPLHFFVVLTGFSRWNYILSLST